MVVMEGMGIPMAWVLPLRRFHTKLPTPKHLYQGITVITSRLGVVMTRAEDMMKSEGEEVEAGHTDEGMRATRAKSDDL